MATMPKQRKKNALMDMGHNVLIHCRIAKKKQIGEPEMIRLKSSPVSKNKPSWPDMGNQQKRLTRDSDSERANPMRVAHEANPNLNKGNKIDVNPNPNPNHHGVKQLPQ